MVEEYSNHSVFLLTNNKEKKKKMSGYLVSDNRKVTTHRFIEMKERGEKISMLTSYDMPFGTYQVDRKEGVKNAIKIMKESGCDALKLEGGLEIIDTIKGILDAGIPVMGHLGLTPQSINKFGTYAVRAKEDAEAEKLLSDAKLLSDTGCFSVVLEKVPSVLATRVSKEISVPTIGIGAGNGTDGQILVVDDMLGMTQGFTPRFLRRYADLNAVMTDAIGNYITDVKSSDFPNESESY